LELDELRKVEDRAILQVLQLQQQVGLDILTDGEFRRGSWLTDMAEAVEGFVPDKVVVEWRGPGGGPEASTANVVGGKLRQRRPLTAHEVAFLKKHSPGPFKMTLPSLSTFVVASYKPGVTDRFYPTRAELLKELVGIVRREVEALAPEGVSYIQLDAPYYTFYLDESVQQRWRQRGLDPHQALDESIAADNACLEGVSGKEIVLAVHLCRGNSKSRWYTEGGYDPIAEKLFGALKVDRFLLEYDTERAGGFEPLRFVPKGKTVVLGLIGTKEPRLESQEDLIRRIEQAARFVTIENLALSPQCGFASVAAGNLISQDDQRRKLELVVETARKVWS
jgi:5-methyltetrahydropteroyltriglutamate--homocysteine methyltransferase